MLAFAGWVYPSPQKLLWHGLLANPSSRWRCYTSPIHSNPGHGEGQSTLPTRRLTQSLWLGLVNLFHAWVIFGRMTFKTLKSVCEFQPFSRGKGLNIWSRSFGCPYLSICNERSEWWSLLAHKPDKTLHWKIEQLRIASDELYFLMIIEYATDFAPGHTSRQIMEVLIDVCNNPKATRPKGEIFIGQIAKECDKDILQRHNCT